MDLSKLSQEDIVSIKSQLSQLTPGTRGSITIGNNDSEFYIYIPPEINDNTGIQIAGRGGGGIEDCNETFNHVLDNQCNSIVLAPIHLSNTEDWINGSFNIIDCIKDENPSIANTTVIYQGYSASFGNTMHAVCANTDRGYAVIPVLMEPRDIYNNVVLTQEEINCLKQTDTPLIYFDIDAEVFNGDIFEKAQSDISEFAKQGLTIYQIEYTAEKNNKDSHGFVRSIGAESELWGLSNGTFDITALPRAINHKSIEYLMSYKIYKYNENGEKILITDPNEQKSIFTSIMSRTSFKYDLEDVNHMINEYKKQINLYSRTINERLSSINSIMNEFLTTDAGFIEKQITEITSICNSTEIKNMIIANNYRSTTSSPRVQDVKMLEYKAKILGLIDEILSYLNTAMINQIEIERTEHDINNEASALSGNIALDSAYIGLASAADALGYTGDKKQEYINNNMQQYYSQYFSEEATKASENQGLTGKEKDEYIENYMNNKIEEYKKYMDDNYSYVIEETTIEK